MRACCQPILIFALLGSAVQAQEVRIDQGRLHGTTEHGAEVFKNIPFAAPPVGPLRWKAPQPARGWTGTRDATAFGMACVQPPFPLIGGPIGTMLDGEGQASFGEDCLNLNVRRPAGTRPGAKLPVMVWVYGGSFSFGRNSQTTYTGTGLVNRGVILVTPNYRLGPLGFLAHPDLSRADPHGSSGNYGALDVVAALRWVKRNIGAFGGDPNNVTVFGESAGGAMVGYLAGSPLTRGLFRRAISESGVFFGPPDRGGGPRAGASDTMLADAERAGAAFLQAAGASTIAEARALPAERILAAAAPAPGRPPVFFRPNVDGWFLPKLSYDLLREGAYDRPVIVGSNDDEGVLMVPRTLPAAQAAGMVRAAWQADADRLLAAYGAATDAQATAAARDIGRDATFAWPAWTWGRYQRGAPVYVYNFNHRPPYPASPEFDAIGAPHAAELPYVFARLDAPRMRWGSDDRVISETMIGFWTNFAKSGDPNGAGLPRWEPFTPRTRSALQFNQAAAQPGTVANFDKLQLIDGIFDGRRAASGK